MNPAAGRRWRIAIRELGRPATLNRERSGHWTDRSRSTRAWRETAAWLWRAERVPRLAVVGVDVQPVYATRRSWPDVGGVFPSAKAAVDGLVDAGVIEDDGPDHVRRLTFHPPVLGDWDGLVVVVSDLALDADGPGTG